MNINLELFNPNQLITKLSSKSKEKAWTKSQNAATAQSRWQIYLNQLALDVLIPFIEEIVETSMSADGHPKYAQNSPYNLESIQSLTSPITGIEGPRDQYIIRSKTITAKVHAWI